MRLKTFSAKSMAEVMAQVREAMGADAIIVSVEQSRKTGVRVTAAADGPVPAEVPEDAPRTAPSPAETEERRPGVVTRAFDEAELKAVVAHHGLPFALADRLIDAARAFEAASLPDALGHGLAGLVDFAPLGLSAPRPIMLVGPPGAGKTVALAKLAAEALLNGKAVRLITADTIKAGGVQQLDQFAQLMECGAETAAGPDELRHLVTRGPASDLTLIDSCGVSPFSMDELEGLLHLLKASGAEPVLVLPAGLDADDAADTAGIFAKMGARRMIATRLDTARRYGSVITAARAGRLALAGISRTPFVAEALEAPGAMLLARLLSALPQSKPATASASAGAAERIA